MLVRRTSSFLLRGVLALSVAMGGFLAAGLPGLSLGQDVLPPRHPIAAAMLEGAPPDPDAITISPDVAAVLEKNYPRSVDDLRVIEQQVARVLRKVVPATVGIQIGPSAGSGVIISPDGLVLTAGHVSGEPGRNALFIMPDGRRVRGRTLGLNRQIDSGLMQIVEKGPWPYVDMAPGEELEAGEWVVATGHPGGFSSDRTPPVRLGRILYANEDVICTDCTLVGGDSGGPLFNMKGEVVGIHSRIGRSITSNFHVPIATYHDTWDRLAAGEMWGGRLPSDERGHVRPYLGINIDGRSEGILVTQVSPGAPAERAGIRANDVIRRFAGVEVSSRDGFIQELWTTQPGQRIELELKRGEETLTVRLVVGGLSQALPGSPEYVPRERRRRPRNPESENSPQSDAEEPDERENGEGDDPSPDSDGSDEPGEQPSEPPAEEGNEEDNGAGDRDGEDGEDDGVEPPPAKAPETPPEEVPEAAGGKIEQATSQLLALGIELDPVALRCVISRVAGDSAAEKAGLRAGDVIASIGGKKVSQASDLPDSLQSDAESSDGLPITVLRQGREVEQIVKTQPD